MSNFLQWNPGQANQETDAQYAADSMRAGGAGNPSIAPSSTFNKVLYQLTTFAAAFAQALTNKGYTVTDASLSNLAAVLANVMTAVDMSAYATKASPAFSGVPTAPTPASGDNSGTLATTAFVKEQAFQSSLGFTPVQQGGGTGQASNKVYFGWDGTNPRLQIDSTDLGGVALQSWVNAQGFATQGYVFANYTPLSDFALANPGGSAAYCKLPNGVIMQFGQVGAGTATAVTMPVAFASGFYQVMLTNIGPGGGTMDARLLGAANVNSQSFKIWVYDQTGAASSTNVSWIAIGY